MVHTHNTRYRLLLNLPQPRSNLLLRSIFYTGLKVFNDLSPEIKMSRSVHSFKYRMKRDLLNSYVG